MISLTLYQQIVGDQQLHELSPLKTQLHPWVVGGQGGQATQRTTPSKYLTKIFI